MSSTRYPERGRHRAAHELFMQDFAQLSQELEASGLAPSTARWIAVRVPEWFAFHVQVNDVPLERFLSSRRRPQEPSPGGTRSR